MRYVREKEKEWNVDTEKVIVCGFSAGGHLAGSLGAVSYTHLFSKCNR